MSNEAIVKNKSAAYLLLARDKKRIQEQMDNIKNELEPYLLESETNAKGSYVIPFSELLEIGGTKYKSLQKVRKESRVLNEDRALAFLTQDQAFESALVTVQHVDQDALWDLYVNDFISQKELDSFYDVTVTWAFQPVKE